MLGRTACRQIGERLLDHAAGRLAPEEQTLVREHLERCVPCRRKAEEFGQAVQWGAELRQWPVPVSRAAWVELRRQIEADGPRAAPRSPGLLIRAGRQGALLLAGTAALALALLLGRALHGSHRTAPDEPMKTAVNIRPTDHRAYPGLPSPVDRRSPPFHMPPGPAPAPHTEPALHAPALVVHDGKARPGAPPPGGSAGTTRAPEPADDLAYVNHEAESTSVRWARLQPNETERIERDWARTSEQGDDFVLAPPPRVAGLDDRALAAARAAWQRERAIVDPRLARRVTVADKGIAFSDLCEHWTRETGIRFSASRMVADDKVTLFCKDKPLREIMRQITAVFGFCWARTGDEADYRYELLQDLKSRFQEEELRNRDREEALLALDREMERRRKYLDLSPEEAEAKIQSAPQEERAALRDLAGPGRAAVKLYFGLSSADFEALRNGQSIAFGPSSDRGPLPAALERDVLKMFGPDRIKMFQPPGGTLIAAGPDAHGIASLFFGRQGESGEVHLNGMAGFEGAEGGRSVSLGLATGESPSMHDPENAHANAALAHDPALAKTVSVEPKPTGRPAAAYPEGTVPMTTTGDILEALHRATGQDVIGDFFMPRYSASEATVRNVSAFDALNRLCDNIHMRWTKADGWLRFRTTSFFNLRLKEIPNRLLARWAASRRQNRFLTAHDLMEIAQLTDAQLSVDNEDAAKGCYGLAEWDLATSGQFRAHWRFLGSLPAALREAAFSDAGLAVRRMPVASQEQFARLVLYYPGAKEEGRLEDVANATMWARYVPPDSTGKAPDVRFTYLFGGANIPRMRWEITPTSSSLMPAP